MMSHDARVQKIVETLRSASMAAEGWVEFKLPRIGVVWAHVCSQESSKAYGWNEVWARLGSREFTAPEFRGSAEKVAQELCKLLQAPSKAVGEAAAIINSKKFDGLREPEMAAIYDLDEETTFKAMAFLAEQGVAQDHGDFGWARTA